jgi:hypothetical protein
VVALEQSTDLLPKLARNRKRLDAGSASTNSVVSGLVQVAVMAAAERDSEFIAHLHPDRPRLCKAGTRVMKSSATSASFADEAGASATANLTFDLGLLWPA